VERATRSELSSDGNVSVLLNAADFATAARVAGAIDQKLGVGTAAATDAGTITIKVPEKYGVNIVSLIADIGDLTVTQDVIAKVVVNERTGTVVVGGAVKISSCAVSHGNLSVEITGETAVSQPQPLSKGNTVATTSTSVEAREQDMRLVELKDSSNIGELVKALNALKVTPRDIIAILQAIKEAGALSADLEVI
jgi:flagellar P-ring protein precursor FlgI